MARVLEQMALNPVPVIGAEAARAQVDHGIGWCRAVAAPAAREASSVSMALICAMMGIWAGEPGRARARLAASSRLARSSSGPVRSLTWCGRSGTGRRLCAVVLLGQHVT